ncbi:oxidoreductase [Terriglobus sp. ADX1]|uniref:oxidoreductase n=1 Tax=Terriglobus sp. ADX1 TaxID=2794063 RepID=UPI002FE64A6E
MKTNWTAQNIPSQQGRRVLITGANSGIGFHTALELARRGAEIILPARTTEKAESAAAAIRQEVPNAKLLPEVLDLAELSSVAAFAERILQRYPQPSLDLLINNAGVMAIPHRQLTPDGYERQFATNYLGPFALTALLFRAVKPQAGSRIVIVSSTASKMGKIDFENLQSERRYSPMWGAYAQSKLADSIFAIELQRRLTALHSPVIVTAAHPGYAITNLQTSGPGDAGFLNPLRIATKVLKPFLSQDAHHGALPTLFAATDPSAEPGGYYGPDGFQELKGLPAKARIAAAALDPATASKLWHITEQLTGVQFPLA